MSNFFSFFTDKELWFTTGLSWIIGFLILFFILMIPAYFIFWPFFESISQELAAFFKKLIEKTKSNRDDRKKHLDDTADEYLKDGGLRRLKSEGEGHWLALIKEQMRVLKKLKKPVGKAAQSLTILERRIKSIKEQIEKIEISEIKVLPTLPNATTVTDSAKKLKNAWWELGISGVLLLLLTSVNTGMLGQILRDLGVVPATIAFVGIPLSSIFAFILTLVEAGLGFAHSAIREKAPDKFAVWPSIIIIFSVILSFVEGFFYSRIAPRGTLLVPFTNYSMPQTNVFFLWGFVLVLTLFTLGYLCFNAGAVVLSGSESSTLRREIKKLLYIHTKYTNAFESSKINMDEAKTAVTNIDAIVSGPISNSESVRQQLDLILNETKTLKNETPEWVIKKEEGLSRVEVHQLAQIAGLWLLLAIFGIIVVTITGYNNFAAFYPVLQRIILWILAGGQAIGFLGVGFLLSSGTTIVQGEQGRRNVLTSPQFSRIAAYIIGALLLIAYFVIFFAVKLSIEMRVVWILNLLIGLLLVAAGYQLAPLLNVIRLWLLRLWNFTVHILEILSIILIFLVKILVIILESIFYLLALPLVNFFRKREERRRIIQS